jgi:hypothetical protein
MSTEILCKETYKYPTALHESAHEYTHTYSKSDSALK